MPQQARLFTTPRPVHELYDLENDPFELRNLAEDPRYREELTRLQTVCEAWQTEVRAVHVMPESLLAGEDQTFASRWYIFHVDGGEQRWAKLFRAATQRSEFAVAARPPAQEPGVRWWQATGLFGRLTEHDASDLLIRQLDDSSEGVRVAAPRSLWSYTQTQSAISECLKGLLQRRSETVWHAALLAIDELPGAAAQLSDRIYSTNLTNNYLRRVAADALSQQ